MHSDTEGGSMSGLWLDDRTCACEPSIVDRFGTVTVGSVSYCKYCRARHDPLPNPATPRASHPTAGQQSPARPVPRLTGRPPPSTVRRDFAAGAVLTVAGASVYSAFAAIAEGNRLRDLFANLSSETLQRVDTSSIPSVIAVIGSVIALVGFVLASVSAIRWAKESDRRAATDDYFRQVEFNERNQNSQTR